MLIPISNVICSDRIRPVNDSTVIGLAASIREVGLLNPITVCLTTVVRSGRAQDGYALIGGLHRLEAAKSLGWDEIEATITDLTGPAAVIAECDENLCGTNLTASERALFTRRRKEAYEALHPETRNGENQHSRVRQVGEGSPAERFTADTAKKTGQSERAVQRDASRGERVAPEVLSQIAGTKLDTGKTLDELALVPKDEQQAKVQALIKEKDDRKLVQQAGDEIVQRDAHDDAALIILDYVPTDRMAELLDRLDAGRHHKLTAAIRRELKTGERRSDRPVFDNTRAA